MDWQAALEQERAALMRLVALLHALADLAECAAGRSAGLRALVLWLLRRAGAVAHGFLTDQFLTDQFLTDPFLTDQFAADPFAADGPAAMAAWQAGNRPEDAMRLAASLRALACLLEAQAALPFSLRDGRAGRTARFGYRRAAGRVLQALVAPPALAGPAADTS
jgi:hypothetical protein